VEQEGKMKKMKTEKEGTSDPVIFHGTKVTNVTNSNSCIHPSKTCTPTNQSQNTDAEQKGDNG
jgi:hypothetical protein